MAGGYFLRFLGSIIIYLFEIIMGFLFKRKIPSFKDVWSAPYNANMPLSVTSELKQKMIGFGFILFLLILIHYFPKLYW
jgi:hypothetical protein